jgi:hypothetical protein
MPVGDGASVGVASRKPLREAAFDLTREIAASDDGRALRQLLADLRSGYDADSKSWKGRGLFQYQAAHHGLRLSGYARAAALLNLGAPSSGRPLSQAHGPQDELRLSEAEVDLLVRTEQSLLQTTRRGLTPLFEQFPHLTQLFDPDISAASMRPVSRPLAASSPAAFPAPSVRMECRVDERQVTAPRICSDTVTESLVAAISAHPAHQLLLRLAEDDAARRLMTESTGALWSRMEHLRNAFWDEGARGIPRIWTRHMHLLGPTSPARIRFRVVAAAFALRRSLGVLHELVFQRLIDMKPVLSSDLLVSVVSSGWTEISTGAVVRLIPDRPGQRLGRDLAEFVAWVTAQGIVSGSISGLAAPHAAVAELTYRSGGSGPYGEVYEYDVRKVDDFFNPYPGLLTDRLVADE